MEHQMVRAPKQYKRLPQLNKSLGRVKRGLAKSEFYWHCQYMQDRLNKAGLDVWDSLKLNR
jgi:hypothetical protein